MATTSHDEKTVLALNSLLRGELSAVETYDQGLGKFADHPTAADRLRALRGEHQKAVEVLRDHVTKLGGTPSTGSGPWGTVATAVNAAAKVLGPETVLASLATGEQHGINSYTTALAAGLPAECETLIRSKLLPQCQTHLAELDAVKALVK